MRFVKYLTIFILLTVQYSFQESSSENLLPTETLSSADKSLSSENGSSSEDVLMQNDVASGTNSQEASLLENAEETEGITESVDQNPDNEGNNDENDILSESSQHVDDVVTEDKESMEENGSNSNGEVDNNDNEDLPEALTSENLDESEVNEVGGDSSNDNDINQEFKSYEYEPIIDLGFVVDPENLPDQSKIQTSTEVPEISKAIKKPVSNSIETVDLRTNNDVSKNRITKGFKTFGSKVGSFFKSAKNKAKNIFKSSNNRLNSILKNGKSKLKDSPKNLKNKFSFFSGKERSKKLVSKGADKREKRSVLTQSVKGLGKDITKGFKKAVNATKRLFKN
uniref:Uncharacterized protein n=1 Tax=Strongyloides venezuelensis TaxID=75913 RepID=A0A0K0G3L2_STRVS